MQAAYILANHSFSKHLRIVFGSELLQVLTVTTHFATNGFFLLHENFIAHSPPQF